MIRLLTRQSEDFDILTEKVDTGRSAYIDYVPDYAKKVKAFYQELGIPAAIWTWPEDEPPEFFEDQKPVEYLLVVEETRPVCYVDEWEWSYFLADQRSSFRWSRAPERYDRTSILLVAPIRSTEIKEVRRYRANRLGRSELVSKKIWSGTSDKV